MCRPRKRHGFYGSRGIGPTSIFMNPKEHFHDPQHYFRFHINGKSGLEIRKVMPFRAGKLSFLHLKSLDSQIFRFPAPQIPRLTDPQNREHLRFPDSQSLRPVNLRLLYPQPLTASDSYILRTLRFSFAKVSQTLSLISDL